MLPATLQFSYLRKGDERNSGCETRKTSNLIWWARWKTSRKTPKPALFCRPQSIQLVVVQRDQQQLTFRVKP